MLFFRSVFLLCCENLQHFCFATRLFICLCCEHLQHRCCQMYKDVFLICSFFFSFAALLSSLGHPKNAEMMYKLCFSANVLRTLNTLLRDTKEPKFWECSLLAGIFFTICNIFHSLYALHFAVEQNKIISYDRNRKQNLNKFEKKKICLV